MLRSSASMFALHASLGLALLPLAGCRELTGPCSKRADTLCLQLSDRAQLPEQVTLRISDGRTDSATKDVSLPNVVETLQKRPYIVEIELGSSVPERLYLDANALRATPQDPGHVIASASLQVVPAGAARPTLMTLEPVGQDLPDLSMPTDGPSSTDDDLRMVEPADLAPLHWSQRYTNARRQLRAISGAKNGGLTIWAVGDSGLVVRGDGNTFAPTAAPSAGQLTGLWVMSATTAWVCDRAGGAYVTTDGGASWNTSVTLPYELYGIAAHSMTDVLVVGDNVNNGHHFDGTTWNPAPHNLGMIATAVWASPDTYYVVGEKGRGARTTTPEVAWTAIPTLATSDLRGLGGHALSNGFTISVGDAGVAQGFVPATGSWTNLGFVNSTTSLRAAYVTAVNAAYVAGTGGAIYAYNGAWSSPTAPTWPASTSSGSGRMATGASGSRDRAW